MRNRIAPALGFLLASFVARAAAGEPAPLTQPEMQQVLRTLQAQFAQPEAVNFAALNRAAIHGLLRENADTMQLLTVPDAAPAIAAPPLSESLTPHIACLRPASFSKESAALVKEALTKLAAGEPTALILDLRAAAADDDPAAAAALAEIFLPKDTPLFLFPAPLKTSSDPVWTRELTVLIDRDACNVAEILATVLKAKQRAIFVGETTRGRTAAIATLPLRRVDGGSLVLRYAAQRVSFSDGTDPFGRGVVPDIAAPMETDAKRAVFELQAKEGLSRSVFDKARPRTNEAALVTRTNPELPERIARTAGRPPEYGVPLIDRPLQLAVDILIARRTLEPAAAK
jgi:hypothetical protein